MLQGAGLSGETGWHLRKMDWCYEAGEALDDEVMTYNPSPYPTPPPPSPNLTRHLITHLHVFF
ncbi:hypothetical protein FKM82_024379 [Ascaphus truei]